MKAVVTTFKVGGIARFSCSLTHFLDGNRTLQCLPHGEWSGIVPQCKSKFLNYCIQKCFIFLFGTFKLDLQFLSIIFILSFVPL